MAVLLVAARPHCADVRHRRPWLQYLAPLPSPRAVAAALLCSCFLCEAQIPTTTGGQLFGSKSVLQRFKDQKCKTIDNSGQGITQAWVLIPGTDACYDLTQGYQCTYRCIVKLACQYDTGSGVIIREMDDQDCTGLGKNVRPFAPHLYWLQAKGIFEGECVSDGAGKYLQFFSKLGAGTYPDCSSMGDLQPGADAGALMYETSYNLQFYGDTSCDAPYQVSTYSDRPTSAFEFKLYRGAMHCYDMNDATPRGNSTARDINYNMTNWRFVCGNTDMVGNGIMIEGYTTPKCTGRTSGAQQWKDVFYPMNFPDTMELLQGKCVRWGLYSAKFDRRLDPAHYPDCKSWSCKDPKMPCTGGRVTDPSSTVGTMYRGEIRTSGGDPAWPLSSSNRTGVSPAPRRSAPSAAAAAVVAVFAGAAALGAAGAA